MTGHDQTDDTEVVPPEGVDDNLGTSWPTPVHHYTECSRFREHGVYHEYAHVQCVLLPAADLVFSIADSELEFVSDFEIRI